MDILSQLKEWKIEGQLHFHEPFFTCEEAEVFYKSHEGGHSKNLFIRDKKGEQHHLLVIESHKRLDLKAFGALLNERFSFASEERLWKYLKVKPGAVSPLNLIYDEDRHVKVWIDEDLWTYEWLYYHPGQNDQTFQLRSEDLKGFLDQVGQEWRSFTVPLASE